MPSSLRIAVLSDLHAAPKSASHPPGDVKLFTDEQHVAATDHPIEGLKELIKKRNLKVDVVVCPGDMTNRANAQALGYVWTALHDLSGLLSADGVVATVGNHDLDSRGHSLDSFPREQLMRLQPPFPASDSALSDRYWAHGFCVQDMGQARFLVLNTCWLHEARDELERGVITDYTLERIKAQLSAMPKQPLNIAVCHHHPHPHTDLKLGFDDVIRNGQKLLNMLADDGHWMVIHGHKHHAKIEYAQGQFRQPIVLACGSFSGRLEGDNAQVSKNYFHVVDLLARSGGLAGQITSWTWVPGLGWKEYASTPPVFPSRVGFGATASIEQLAESISRQINSAALEWTDLVAADAEIQYLMPKELKALIDELKTQYRIETVYDEFGFPKQLGPGLPA
jgi:3',5'-cyclic AMP phosphodiesterase CpdA